MAGEEYGLGSPEDRGFNQLKNYVYAQVGQIALYEVLVREAEAAPNPQRAGGLQVEAVQQSACRAISCNLSDLCHYEILDLCKQIVESYTRLTFAHALR